MKEYPVEIFCIGTELLTALTQDTNSYWMAKELNLLGCTLRRITVLPDDPPDMAKGLRDAFDRETPVVITSGGLGPTPDDLTVAVVAEMLGVKPVLHEGILAELMERRGIQDRADVRPALLSMCKVPEGAAAYPNPVGAAPCIKVNVAKTTLFMMPGPPREVQAVFNAHVKPFIQAASPLRIASRRVVIVNMAEAEVGPILAEVMHAYPGTYLKSALTAAHRVDDVQHLPVDVVCRAENADAAAAGLSQTLQHFEELLYQRGRQLAPAPPP